MKTGFRKSFTRDLKKIKDKDLLARVPQVIKEVEAANNWLSSILLQIARHPAASRRAKLLAQSVAT